MPSLTDLSEPTLIYDGECGICRTSVELVRRWDREHVLRVVPFQDAVAVARFPIALPALAAAMHLVLPDGRVYAGADAIPELLRLFPGSAGWRCCFGFPACCRSRAGYTPRSRCGGTVWCAGFQVARFGRRRERL